MKSPEQLFIHPPFQYSNIVPAPRSLFTRLPTIPLTAKSKAIFESVKGESDE